MCILPLNGAVEFLHQVICLWVIWGTKALLNPQGLTQVEIHLKINFENNSLSVVYLFLFFI